MLEAISTVTAGGRIVIPSTIRKSLNIDIGQEVILKVESGSDELPTLKNAIEQAKDLYAVIILKNYLYQMF